MQKINPHLPDVCFKSFQPQSTSLLISELSRQDTAVFPVLTRLLRNTHKAPLGKICHSQQSATGNHTPHPPRRKTEEISVKCCFPRKQDNIFQRCKPPHVNQNELWSAAQRPLCVQVVALQRAIRVLQANAFFGTVAADASEIMVVVRPPYRKIHSSKIMTLLLGSTHGWGCNWGGGGARQSEWRWRVKCRQGNHQGVGVSGGLRGECRLKQLTHPPLSLNWLTVWLAAPVPAPSSYVRQQGPVITGHYSSLPAFRQLAVSQHLNLPLVQSQSGSKARRRKYEDVFFLVLSWKIRLVISSTCHALFPGFQHFCPLY